MSDKKEGNSEMFAGNTDSEQEEELTQESQANNINADQKMAPQSIKSFVVSIVDDITIDSDEELVFIDEHKNVITKTDVEKVLELKFASSKTTQDFQMGKIGIDEMRLSYHNFGAFQAYQRAKAKRIRELAKLKLGLNLIKDSDEKDIERNDSHSDDTKRNAKNYRNLLSSLKCDPKIESCDIIKKTRRLAEALISNLEEIKFYAGGACDLCGRDSCDGFNHFPQETPVEQEIQVVSTDIDEAALQPPDIEDYDSQLTLPSTAAFAPYNSQEEITSIFEHTPESSHNIKSDSSDTEDVFQSFALEETNEFPSTFTIYFKRMDLKLDGLEFLEFSNRGSKGLRLSYIFLMYKESIEFEIVVQGISLSIDSMKVHPFSMNPIIYQYLRNCCLNVELYDIPLNVKRKAKYLGNCNICFQDLLSAEQNSKSMKLLISDKERVAFVQSGKPTELGYLFVHVSLGIDQEHLQNLAKTVCVKRSPIDIMGTGSYTDFLEHIESSRSLTRSLIKLPGNIPVKVIQDWDIKGEPSEASLISNMYDKGLITDTEQKAFTDALQLVLVRNKALRTRQSEIDTELNDRAEWMHEELKWRLTLQEHAILSGKDPESVRWRQWRDENTSDVRIRTLTDDEIEYEPAIIITVQHLELLPTSQVILDETIKLIYIEYAFLTHSGLELETKSLPKTSEGIIVYDFVKKFDISIDRDNLDTHVLAEHIKTNQSIKFIAVHEPIERQEELQTCTALGSCEINLFNLAQHVSNTHEEVYPLKNTRTGLQDIGHLKIRFDGVRAMRTVALTLLAPSAFRIYK